jgi:hypothetical protein
MALVIDRRRAHVEVIRAETRWTRRWVAAFWLLITLILTAIAYSTAPRGFALALTVVVVGALTALIRPVFGVYFVAFCGALGDGVAAPWYPFLKNLSSKESTLFVTSSLSVNPAEIVLACTAIGWVVGMAGRREWRLVRGPIFWPLLGFGAFALLALVSGIGNGGDTTVALYEFRPFVLLVLLFVLATNLLQSARQWRLLIWLLMVALVLGKDRGMKWWRRDTVNRYKTRAYFRSTTGGVKP